MDEKQLQALANELAKNLKTPDDLNQFDRLLKKISVEAALVSKVTDAVMELVVEWQNRPLDAIYPIVYLDCIVLKVRQDSRVINKSVFLALGINIEGQKELLGMWLAENEGAKFWLNVLTELKNRGLNDILIACVDGLKGFPEPSTQCIPKRVSNCVSCIWCATAFGSSPRRTTKPSPAT